MKLACRRLLFAFFVAMAAIAASAVHGDDAREGRPVSRVFEAPELHSKGPVLSFAETGDGCLFVGSNYLVVFDGLRTQRIDIPGAYAFRGLAAGSAAPESRERLWVGAIGAIGYVEQDRVGTWNFVSLAPQLAAAGIASPGEIWFAAPLGAGAVFVSAQQILRWDGRRFQSWTLQSPRRLQAFADEGGSAWVCQEGAGLYQVGPSGPPTLARTANTLPSGSVQWFLRPQGPPASGAAGMLMGTDDGVFRLTEAGYARLDLVSAVLNGEPAAQAAVVEPGEMAIATSRNGLVMATPEGEVRAVVNHSNGLRDDAIYGLWCDRRGGIWVGLDDGCVRLDSVGDVSIFDAREGLERGLPRKVVADGGATCVLTDKAFYRLSSVGGGARLEPVIASHPLLHDAAAGPGGLWIAGAGGIWRAEGGQAAPVIPIRGNVERIAAVPWLPGGVVYLEDRVLTALEPVPSGGWVARQLGARIGDAPLSLAVDSAGRIWVSTARDGIYCFAPSVRPASSVERPTVVLAAHYREGSGLPRAAAHPIVSIAGSSVFAFTETGILSLGTDGAFEPAAGFADWEVLAATGSDGSKDRESAGGTLAYWVARRIGMSETAPYDLWRVRASGAPGGPLRWDSLRVAGLDNLGEITSLDFVEGDDGGVVWIGGTGGLLRVDAVRCPLAGSTRPLQIREVRTDAGGLLDLHPSRSAIVGPESHRIEISFSAAQPMEVLPTAVFYQTRLENIEADWTQPQRSNTREFTGLPPGNYVFKVRRVDRHGRAGESVSYPFMVIAPWFLRRPAIVAYIAALALAVAGLMRWRLRLLRLETERLDRLVAQRTRELELSNTAKSEFLENISHEIRNPLHGIVGLAAVLKPNQPVPEDVVRSLNASAEHLRRVSEDVLGFSKLEFGGVSVAEKPMALGRLLRDVAGLYADSAARQGNTINLFLPPGPDVFVGDEAKIKTIVGNFVANALKYAPGTAVELRADWTSDADGGCQAYIAVTDRGPGVPTDEQELVFQKFVRGRAAKQVGVIGSGLGLATCRMLARGMGGTVGVESPAQPPLNGSSGPGSTFHLWLPLRRAEEREAPAPAAAENGSGRALIVDDEEYNRLVVAGLARELGFEPLTAGSAAEAREIARTRLPEIVFLDLELPGTKGDELARELRRLPNGNLPVILAMTGQDSDEARRRCEEAGMDGFILKPFDGAQIRSLIARVRARERAATAPRRRAFELYARGAGESVEFAVERFLGSLAEEIGRIRAGRETGDRVALAAAAHRLRTLGSLAEAGRLSDLANRLQDRTATLSSTELERLVGEIIVEAGRLDQTLRA